MSFIASGRMEIKDVQQDSIDTLSLVIGKKSPEKMIKIELTHPWGRPLIHILIKGNEAHILSFPEKRYYTISVDDIEFARTLPGGGGKVDHVWGLLRGFPVLQPYGRAETSPGRSISLFTDEGEKREIIRFIPGEDLPSGIFFPGSWTEIFFSDYSDIGGIMYAKKVKAIDQKAQTGIRLQIERMTFNKPVPESIFEIKIPDGFKSP